MTLLASWLGVDSRKPASIYIMADSRISWGEKGKFDFGKKVFGCKNFPDIFGYCGDVLFPSIVLNQIVELVDQGLLFNDDDTCEEKSQAVLERLIYAFNSYPKVVGGLGKNGLQVIHCSRDKNQDFYCKKISWSKSTNKWSSHAVEFADFSDKLFVLGSGAAEFELKYKRYWESENKKTSRALFHCFNDSLQNIQDIYCGGAPQLVGLYRIGNARHYGIIYENKRYFQGLHIDNIKNYNNIEWRNELFEICDGNTMKIEKGAQRQPNPLAL